MEIDALVEMEVARAEAADGRQVKGAALNGMVEKTIRKAPGWSEKEDEYLRENLGMMTDAEIGAALGRSEIAVHLRAKRINLDRPSKDARYLTAHRTALLLGVDAHKVCYWIDSGLLEGERLAGPSKIRRVRKYVLLEWVLDPEHWIWFDWRKVADPRLREKLEERARVWGDEWLTSRQVAALYGLEKIDIDRHIKLGRMKGVQARNMSGRDKGTWAYWFVRRSEAIRARDEIMKTRRLR